MSIVQTSKVGLRAALCVQNACGPGRTEGQETAEGMTVSQAAGMCLCKTPPDVCSQGIEGSQMAHFFLWTFIKDLGVLIFI